MWPVFHKKWPWDFSIYLPRDPLPHLGVGRGSGVGGVAMAREKGVFPLPSPPTETELRELCLVEGGRVMHVTVTFNLGGRRSPILRPQTCGLARLRGAGCVTSIFSFAQPLIQPGRRRRRRCRSAACIPHLRPPSRCATLSRLLTLGGRGEGLVLRRCRFQRKRDSSS